MEKIIIFGIGTMVLNKESSFWKYLKSNNYVDKIMAYTDLNEAKATDSLDGIPFVSPDKITTMEYDKIIIGTITSCIKIKNYCLNILNIPSNKIDATIAEYPTISRIEFLKNFSNMVYEKNLIGNVAEGGVFEGNFAAVINKYFPDRTLYLFDTFDGFNDNDLVYEKIDINKHIQKERFNVTNLTPEKILEKMEYPDNIIICKGYFPDTTKGIEDKFVFVNLDFDLYKPTLEGLKYFYFRLVKNGVILVHDFFNESYTGVKKAVTEFCEENNLSYIPIGDTLSIIIVKS